MAKTIDFVVADGTSSVFTIPFPYLDKSHTHVYLNGVETSNFEWLDSGNIRILGDPPASGTLVGRRRITPDTPLVRFSPGNLSSADLNVGDLQPIYLAQEARDWGDRNTVLLEALQVALRQEVMDREAADAVLSLRIDSLLGDVAEWTQRAEAAAIRSESSATESEHHAAVSHSLVEKAVAGFQGFNDGMAYDFGWVADPTTYFDRDWGTI